MRASLVVAVEDQSCPLVHSPPCLLQHRTQQTIFGFGSGASPPSLRACWAFGLSALDPYLFGPFGSPSFVVGFDFAPEAEVYRSSLHGDRFISW